MQNISIIKDFINVVDAKPLDLILTEIRTGFYEEEIVKLQNFYSLDRLGHYENTKRGLLSFTPNGTHKKVRSHLELVKYSHYLIMDTRKTTFSEIDIISKLLREDPYTLAFFRSPSRRSIKIVVEVSTSWAYHKEALWGAKEHYEKILSIPFRITEHDFPQLCYYSFDSDLYQNPNHQILQVQIPEE